MGQRQTCKHCGQEITFRFIDGALRPIHPYGGCGQSPYSADSLRKAVKQPCPKCGERAWLVRHNGGTVWMDELGPPWPKHPCVQNQTKVAAVGAGMPGMIRCSVCQKDIRADYYYSHCKTKHKGIDMGVPKAASNQALKLVQQKRDYKVNLKAPQVLRKSVASSPSGYKLGVSHEKVASGKKQVLNSDSGEWISCPHCASRVSRRRYERHLRRIHGIGSTPLVAPKRTPALTVAGVLGTQTTLSLDEISRLGQYIIPTGDGGGRQVQLRCSLLIDVLTLALTSTGVQFEETAGCHYLVAESLGGQRAVFAWVELDPQFTTRKVYVAHSAEDGVLPVCRFSVKWSEGVRR